MFFAAYTLLSLNPKREMPNPLFKLKSLSVTKHLIYYNRKNCFETHKHKSTDTHTPPLGCWLWTRTAPGAPSSSEVWTWSRGWRAQWTCPCGPAPSPAQPPAEQWAPQSTRGPDSSWSGPPARQHGSQCEGHRFVPAETPRHLHMQNTPDDQREREVSYHKVQVKAPIYEYLKIGLHSDREPRLMHHI